LNGPERKRLHSMSLSLDAQALLQLLQLADSALPIGSAAHSFGVETLVAEELLTVEHLAQFLEDYLHETGTLESIFCRRAYVLVSSCTLAEFEPRWLALNDELSALKTARESRTASATLGRRFLQLVQGLEESPLLHRAIQSAKDAKSDIHYSAAFGLAGSLLRVDETATVLAYLQQTLWCLVSACQRLMPLGQNQASRIVWRLKPTLISIAECSKEVAPEDAVVFAPLPDLGSQRHPLLSTRLFIS
jgi:urease accessory protein